MIRILLADDHILMLEGLIAILKRNFEIVGTAENGRELVEKALLLKPHVALLDMAMPELNGIEAATRLSKLLPSCRLIFVTQQLRPEYVRAALEAGARAYVAKQSAGSELLDAIRFVLAGRYFVTPLVAPKEPTAASLAGRLNNPASLFGARLTPRQRDVLQLIAEGNTAKEIASALIISVKTVDFHRNALMNVLGVRTTAGLTRYAIREGIVTD